MSRKSRMRTTFEASIPRQHGAWSILLSSFAIGALVGGQISVEVVLLLLAIILGYLGRHAVSVYLRPAKSKDRSEKMAGWACVYVFLLSALGAFLLLYYELWLLIALGLVALALGATTVALGLRGKEFTTGGEIVGILGLTLAAPAAEYAASGTFTEKTLGLWVLCAFFFVGSVFHVRYLVRNRKESQGTLNVRLRAGLSSITYHLAVLISSVILGPLLNVLPHLAPLALIPVTVKSLWAVLRRYEAPLPVRQIGYREVAHTLLFILLVGLIYHLG